MAISKERGRTYGYGIQWEWLENALILSYNADIVYKNRRIRNMNC